MKKIILIVGIVLLSTIGVGAFSYFQGWLPFFASDEDVLSTMIENMSKNKTWHTDMNIIISAESPEQGEASIVLDIESDTDRTDIENPKSAIKFDGELNMEGMSFSLGVEMKILGQKDIYFRITTIPALPFLDMLGLNLNELKNQWIKIDQEYLGDILKEDEQDKEIIEKLTKLFQEAQILKIEKKFSQEKIGSINTYHYLVSVNKDELLKIAPEVIEAMDKLEENDPRFENIPKSEREKASKEILNMINEFFNKIGDINFEVWIGKKDKLLYHLEIEKEIDISELSEGQEGSVNIRLKLDFSKFDEEINIEAPEEFKSLDEIFPAEMFQGQVLGEWI